MQTEPDYSYPTIRDARYGWGLSLDGLHELLRGNPDWTDLGPAPLENQGTAVLYQHNRYGYAQCWDFDATGKMEQVRLLIPSHLPELVGAFLVGAKDFGDSWCYVNDMIEHPEAAAPQVFVHEHERMTVLRVRFL